MDIVKDYLNTKTVGDILLCWGILLEKRVGPPVFNMNSFLFFH